MPSGSGDAAPVDSASVGPRTASGSAPEDLPSREGERPSETSVLEALAHRDSERAPPSASDSDSEDSTKGKRKKERKEKKSKKHKKEKKSKKAKKHRKEKKGKKKKKKRERSSGSSSSDSDDDAGDGKSKPVQLSEFMAGSKRTAGDGERYSSVSGLKISNSHEMSEYDKEQAAKRERKLRKLNGAEQDEFQHWGGDFKKKKVTDPAALALQDTLRGINKIGRAGAVLDADLAKSLDSRKR
jgi:outer membrane biosynthesis protein TonB